jgi:hypothetical protein
VHPGGDAPLAQGVDEMRQVRVMRSPVVDAVPCNVPGFAEQTHTRGAHHDSDEHVDQDEPRARAEPVCCLAHEMRPDTRERRSGERHQHQGSDAAGPCRRE